MDRFSANDKFTKGNQEMHIAGTFSATAKSRLQERGWSLHENSTLFTRIKIPEEARS
jgi:hypothetical protein